MTSFEEFMDGEMKKYKCLPCGRICGSKGSLGVHQAKKHGIVGILRTRYGTEMETLKTENAELKQQLVVKDNELANLRKQLNIAPVV